MGCPRVRRRVIPKDDKNVKPCYNQDVLMRRHDFLSEVVGYMEALGWGPYQADREDGGSQFEVRTTAAGGDRGAARAGADRPRALLGPD